MEILSPTPKSSWCDVCTYTDVTLAGEYVLREDEGLGDAAAGAAGAGDDDADLVLPSFDHFSLEEALKIVGLDDKEPLVGDDEESNAATSGESSSLATSASDPVLTSAVQHVKSEADEADEGINAALSEMMQTHPHHHVHHQQHHMYHPSTHHRPPQLQHRET
ncbi:hypothetical protein B566_EDAN004518 [Ephemera danica]|nr:hypothetical protein B566_EDAN004518 [Ephemera danica]